MWKRNLFTKQWSFFWAWVVFGLAQIIYMGGHILASVLKWKTDLLNLSVKPITVTTDLGKMFRALEVAFYKLFNLPDYQLYGKAEQLADGSWISVKWGAFVPGVGWQIIGMAIGGLIVVLLEREPRIWAKYSTKLLLTSFVGGMLFSYGTRLAGGCTLNHLLGGVPMMNIHSTVTLIFMSLWGLLAFLLMSRMGLAQYFKHQETKCYVKHEYEKGNMRDGATYDPNYNPWKRPATWIGIAFTLALFGVAWYAGSKNPEWLRYMSWDDLHAVYKSVAHKGFIYVFFTLLAGIIAGFGMAKSGFGTECALVSVEAASMLRKEEEKWKKYGLPNITFTLFKGLLPLQGVAASWVIVSLFVLITWWFFGMGHGFSSYDPEGYNYKYFLTIGSVLWWFFLGAGAVLLIGCEIRSYMRLGMLYLNTLIGFIGFAIGYLPFTLYYDAHRKWLYSTIPSYLEKNQIFTWPDLVAYWVTGKSDFVAHKMLAGGEIDGATYWATHSVALLVAVLWFLALVWILVWTFRVGKKYLSDGKIAINEADIVMNNTEELHLKLQGEDSQKVCG